MTADRLLTDPTRGELAAALDRAAPSTAADPDRWHDLLDEVADCAEGRSQLESRGPGGFARYLSAAWWSDRAGRKHVRVCAGDASDGGWHPHRSRLDDDPRPPLWHVFMGRVYRADGRWLVSCACGMTGSPRELGWAGERCGPCHDRREEGQPHPDDGRPTLFAGPGRGVAVCFSPDGRWLAASSTGGSLRLYDTTTGEERELDRFSADEEMRWWSHGPLAFSPDGRWLLSGLADEWVINWWDLTEGTEMPGELLVRASGGEEALGYSFSPDGRLMASWSNQGNYVVLTAEGEQLGHDRWGVRGHVSAVAFSPDGETLAVGDMPLVRLLDTRTWDVRRGPEPADYSPGEEEFRLIEYTPDGRRLVCISADVLPTIDGRPPRRRLHAFDLNGDGGERVRPLPFYTRVAGVSPDGETLAYVVHDERHSPAEVRFFDLAGWREAGVLEWDAQDAVNDFAFSPDGETLATISEAGVVKLLPWRLLLAAGE